MSTKAKENIKLNINEAMPIEKALKKFKRLCDTYGIIKEYRKREHYLKPSVKDKEKRESAEKRRKKTAIKNRRIGVKKI